MTPDPQSAAQSAATTRGVAGPAAAPVPASAPPPGRVNDLVDAVLVVGVKKLVDRQEHIRAELGRAGIAFEWIFDFDPPDITPAMVERTFAPSDMRIQHQSAVLKHIQSWRICVERNYRRVLVFEDDVVLDPRFGEVLAQALAEADRLRAPYLIYLGCGDNKYVAGARSSPSVLVPGGPLPAAEAQVLDRESCRMRLAWLEKNKVTRPPDWLLREVDAELGIAHWWLRTPIVVQGSMNGKFTSLLDDKRAGRGRLYAWLRFRWDRLRHHLVGGRTIEVDHEK